MRTYENGEGLSQTNDNSTNTNNIIGSSAPWQANKKCWKEKMEFLYENPILADVLFHIEWKNELTEFSAHKFVLAVGSAVFDTMFNGAVTSNFEEGTIETDRRSNKVQKISISDICPKAFKIMLKYLYSDEISFDDETVVDTIYCAKKYDIILLEKAGEEFLKYNLSAENACLLVSQAVLFDMKDLIVAGMRIIENDTSHALHGANVTHLDSNTLKDILKKDNLTIDELDLFHAVIRWVESEGLKRKIQLTAENKREILGDIVYLIRFPLISVNDFGKHAATSGLLTKDECLNMFLYYTVDSPTKPAIPFSPVPRQAHIAYEFLKHHELSILPTPNPSIAPSNPNYQELMRSPPGFVYPIPATIIPWSGPLTIGM